jgi:uncharacterized RDD family membrane protein YckC
VRTTPPAPVADLDRRFYAFAIDRALAWSLYAVAGIAAWRLFDPVWAVVAVVTAVAGVTLLSAWLLGIGGVSPGKAVTGLRVVDRRSGSPIGLSRALVRTIVLGAGTVPMLGLGVATLAFTAVEDRARERRGWHDHLTGSLVVDVRPRAEAEAEPDDQPRQVVNLTALRLVPAPAVEPEESAPAAARLPPRPTQWRVTFDSGPSLLVQGLGLVGRRPEGRPDEPVRHVVPLPSENMSISKTHAQFQLAPDGTLVVMDRGSTNGSILVRQGVSRELSAGKAATLLDGDRVLFGDRLMQVSRDQA